MKSNFEFKVRLKCAKNLYLSHRFFCKIRQIHRLFDAFRQNLQILCRNQAPSKRPLDARQIRAAHAALVQSAPPGEKPRPLAALTHKKTRHPHEMDVGLKSLATCALLVLVEALTSGNAGLALVNLLLEERGNTTLYGLWVLSCRVHDSNVVCGDQANDVQDLERTLW